jgi:hypothetical protein
VKEEFNSADASYIGYALVKYCGVGGVDELNHKLRTTCDQRLKDLWMALSNLHQRRVEVQPAQWKEEGLSFLSLRRIFIGQSNCPELATKVAVVTAAMKKVGALMYDYIEDVGAVIQEIIDELESADIDLASFHVELERAGAGN